VATIKLKTFGGMAPSANPEYIDPTSATYASDVDTRFKDLRPSLVAQAVATVAAGQTLYKFDGLTTFLTKTGDVDFARGPVVNDTTERTYFTGDGVPKVMDISGEVRQLGVPKPTVAPIVTKTDVPTYTTEDAAQAINTLANTLFEHVRNFVLTVGYEGMVDADLADLIPAANQPWSYLVSRAGSVASGNFVPTTASDICLVDPSLEYSTSSTAITVPLFVRGRRWRADATTLSNMLTAFPSADKTKPTEKLMTADQVTKIAAAVQSALVSRDAEINELIAKIKAEKTSFMALLNDPTKVTSIIAGSLATYYASTEGSTALANAVDVAANRISETATSNAGTAVSASAATTAINARISVSANGTKVLDSNSLINWIYTKIKPTGASLAYDIPGLYQDATSIAANLDTDLKNIANKALGVTGAEDAPYAAVTKALVDKQAKMEEHVKLMELITLDVASTRLKAAIKAAFDANVASSIPRGTPTVILPRAYVFTEVSKWGEEYAESAPSPVSNLLSFDQDDVATIQLPPAPSGRNITHRRLYRSSAGSSSAAYLFHSEFTADVTGVIDTLPASSLKEPCPTFGWDEPPADMKGIAAMPNGIVVGFSGRTIHACEPNHPYAFPAKYDIPLDFDIVGIAVSGQTAIVATNGQPYLMTGVDSMGLTTEKLPYNQACISKRSLVALVGAAIYASPDGLVMVSGTNVSVITEGLLSKADWNAYNPSSIFAAEYEGRYLAFYTRTNGQKGCLVLDFKSMSLVEFTAAADAVFSDKKSDTLYILQGTSVKNFIPASGTANTFKWKSKMFRLGAQTSFAWLQVDADFSLGNVTVKVYAGGNLVSTKTVTSLKPVRLQKGRYREWQIEIQSNTRVTSVAVSSTTAELIAEM